MNMLRTTRLIVVIEPTTNVVKKWSLQAAPTRKSKIILKSAKKLVNKRNTSLCVLKRGTIAQRYLEGYNQDEKCPSNAGQLNKKALISRYSGSSYFYWL